MSVSASAWAWQQKASSPSAKLVLLSLADFANQKAECYPSLKTLAGFTAQSTSSVRRRLVELEEAGLIVRTAQFRKNGSRTADLIRLNIPPMNEANDPPASSSPPPSQIETAPSPEWSEGGEIGDTPLPDWQEPPCKTDSSPLSIVEGPEPSIEPLIENTSPLPPKGGEERVLAKASSEEKFQAFRKAWGSHGAGASWSKAHRLWVRLPPADRQAAQAALSAYLRDCQSRQRKVCHPSTYLLERRWEGYSIPRDTQHATRRADDAITRAVDLARRSENRDGWSFVAPQTPQWRAWQEAFRHAGVAMPGPRQLFVCGADGGHERRLGRHFPSAMPPVRQGAGQCPA